MKKILLFSFVFVVVFSPLASADPNTLYWNGPFKGLWRILSNWNPEEIPTVSNPVIINTGNYCDINDGYFAEASDVNIGEGSYAASLRVFDGSVLNVADTITLGLSPTGLGNLEIGINNLPGVVYTTNLKWGSGTGKVYMISASKLHISGSLGLDSNSPASQGIVLGGGSEVIWKGYRNNELRAFLKHGNITTWSWGSDPNHINIVYYLDLDETHLSSDMVISSADLNKDNSVDFEDFALFAGQWLKQF